MYLFSYLTVKWPWILLGSEGALFQSMTLQNSDNYILLFAFETIKSLIYAVAILVNSNQMSLLMFEVLIV